MTGDAEPALWAAIAQVEECVRQMKIEIRHVGRGDLERRDAETQLMDAHRYVGLLLEDCRRGVEEPVERPERMNARDAFEATLRKLPKRPSASEEPAE